MSPLVVKLKKILSEHPEPYWKVSQRSGVAEGTIKHWYNRYSPILANFEAVLETVGYELKIVKKRK